MATNPADTGTLADENRFSFPKHMLMNRDIDKTGKNIWTDQQKLEKSMRAVCETVKAFKTAKAAPKGVNADWFQSLPDEIELNASADDDITRWRKLGYQTQAEIDAPRLEAEKRVRDAAELQQMLSAVTGKTKKKEE